jgi:hypothetical protein
MARHDDDVAPGPGSRGPTTAGRESSGLGFKPIHKNKRRAKTLYSLRRKGERKVGTEPWILWERLYAATSDIVELKKVAA